MRALGPCRLCHPTIVEDHGFTQILGEETGLDAVEHWPVTLQSGDSQRRIIFCEEKKMEGGKTVLFAVFVAHEQSAMYCVREFLMHELRYGICGGGMQQGNLCEASVKVNVSMSRVQG